MSKSQSPTSISDLGFTPRTFYSRAWRWLLSKTSKNQATFLVLGLPLAVLASALAIWTPQALTILELHFYDRGLRQTAVMPKTDAVAIIDLDEDSLAAWGQWPWPRYRVARLLSKLREAGAAVIATDILFSEADRTSLARIDQDMAGELGIERPIKHIDPKSADNDVLFAQELSHDITVLGNSFQFRKENSRKVPASLSPAALPTIPVMVRASKDAPEAAQFPQALGVTPPLPQFLQAAKSAGFLNTFTDRDNVVRRTPFFITYNDRLYPSLAMAALVKAGAVDSVLINKDDAGFESALFRSKALGDKLIPLEATGAFLVRFRGPGRVFPTFSAGDVLSGELPPGVLDGRIVFIGASATGLNDLRATPLERAAPGVEVHANIVDAILSEDFINHPDWGRAAEVLTTLIVTLLTAALAMWLSPLLFLILAGALGAGLWTGGQYALSEHGMVLSSFYPLIGLVAAGTIMSLARFWIESGQRRSLKKAFARYVSPDVVDSIAKDPTSLSLTGDERVLTLLFSDIRGFTPLTESLSPQELFALLHRYFTPMTRHVLEHQGTVDKYIGDAIMAFWNAPLRLKDHGEKAIRAALAMVTALEEINPGFEADFGHRIEIGIGLHQGMARVGNFGSDERFDYTAIGDTVNICSRVEGLTKYYGVGVLITESLAQSVPTEAVCFEVDRVVVKGKSEPQRIFAVYPVSQASPDLAELEQHAKAYAAYGEGDFAQAEALWQALEAEYKRMVWKKLACHARQLKDIPPDDWQGIFSHTSK